jgi:hypothetical protein
VIDSMREDDHFIMLDIGIDIEEDVQRELLEPLRALGIEAEIPPQGGGNPLEQLTGYINLVNSTFSILATALLVSDRFNAWRRKRQAQQHPEPLQITRTVIISRPRRGPVDPDSPGATDDEIRTYIVEEREQ